MGLACEQALGGAMAARREKEGELATSLWNLNSTSNFKAVALRRLSCQISASQREAETNWNVNKHRKTRAMGNDVITKADISPSWHYNSLSSVNVPKQQLSNFPRVKMGILKLTVRAYSYHFKQIYLLS